MSPRKPAGVSLVEVTIIAALMAAFTASAIKGLSDRMKEMRTTKIRQNLDTLTTRLQTAAASSIVLDLSKKANAALNDCTIDALKSKGVGKADCTAITTPLDLINNPIQPPIAGGVVPVRYDQNGDRCGNQLTPTQQCPFEAYAQFTPNCGGPPKCDQAVGITFEVLVKQARDPADPDPNPLTRSNLRIDGIIPGVFDDRRRVATTNINGAVALKAQNCPAGEVYEGSDKWGSPICTVYETDTCDANHFIWRVQQNLTKAGQPKGVICRSFDTACNPATEVYQGSSLGKGTCVTFANGTCASVEHHVRQIDWNNRKVACHRRIWTACPPEWYATVNASGDIVCAPLPAPLIAIPPTVNNMLSKNCMGAAITDFDINGFPLCYTPSDFDPPPNVYVRGTSDIIAGVREGGGPVFNVHDGTGADLGSWFAYDLNERFGVAVGLADLDKDGRAEVLTVPGPGGGPAVHIFQAGGQFPGMWRAHFSHDPGLRTGNLIGN